MDLFLMPKVKAKFKKILDIKSDYDEPGTFFTYHVG